MESVAIGVRAQSLVVTEDSLIVDLSDDGRSITVPLAWYPRLVQGTPKERNNWRWIGDREGIHWPDLVRAGSLDAGSNCGSIAAKYAAVRLLATMYFVFSSIMFSIQSREPTSKRGLFSRLRKKSGPTPTRPRLTLAEGSVNIPVCLGQVRAVRKTIQGQVGIRSLKTR